MALGGKSRAIFMCKILPQSSIVEYKRKKTSYVYTVKKTGV